MVPHGIALYLKVLHCIALLASEDCISQDTYLLLYFGKPPQNKVKFGPNREGFNSLPLNICTQGCLHIGPGSRWHSASQKTGDGQVGMVSQIFQLFNLSIV